MHDDRPANEPESLSPFLTTAPAVEALNRLERGLGVRRPFLLVTGQQGTGKSTLTHEVIRRWGDRVTTASLTTTGIDSASLPAAMIAAAGYRLPHPRLAETVVIVPGVVQKRDAGGECGMGQPDRPRIGVGNTEVPSAEAETRDAIVGAAEAPRGNFR